MLVAYYTGMRKSEIIFLTWEEVDLQNGFIRLKGERTKTGAARSVHLHPRVLESLSCLPRAIRSCRVFLWKGKPVIDVKKAFKAACTKAGLNDFTFHDLRHCAINNLGLGVNDYFKIMARSGQKTMNVFKRYNLVTEEELSNLSWHEWAEPWDNRHLYGHQKKNGHSAVATTLLILWHARQDSNLRPTD
ncbi:MAG: site-specific integrase [Desulfomonilaceae bacterium]